MKEKKLVPKLRFPGFTEPWEQRKFGDLFEYERPDAYTVKSDNYNNDFNMPVLTANKAFILGYTNEENSYNKPSIIFDDFTLDRKYVDFPYMLKSSAIKILTSKNQHNLRFLFERLNSTRFEVLGHARHYISVVQNTTTLCPSVDEEVCISNLLTKFDELITLHQRKLEHLKLKKKSLLQKLFPKEGEVYPELRFSGFTDPWEQRKLGDFTNQISTSVNPEDAKLPLWSLTAEAGLIEKTDRYERDFLVKKKDQFKRIETNTLVYNPMNITIGSIDIYTGRFPIAVSGYYVSIVYDKTLDTDFLKEILLLPSSLKMYKNYATGSLIERQRVQYHTFSKLQFLFPTLEEQRTIGRLFKSLNLIITLHQRKLEHLQLLKKALLQQLFV